MLPKSCFILEYDVAQKLVTESRKAIKQNQQEIGAILYTKRNIIKDVKFIKNLTTRPGHIEWDIDEYDKIIQNNKKRLIPSIHFHSHPLTDYLSVNDIKSSRNEINEMIFDYPTGNFLLFKIPERIRKNIRKNISHKHLQDISKNSRIPLYVETGVYAIDYSIVKGIKHPQLIQSVKQLMEKCLSDFKYLSLIKHDQLPDRIKAIFDKKADILNRMFDGLEYYIQFPKSAKPKGRMKGINQIESDFLAAAYDAFYSFELYSSYLDDVNKLYFKRN